MHNTKHASTINLIIAYPRPTKLVVNLFKCTLDSRFQGIDQIGALPGEAAICIRRAAKVAVGSCALVDGFVQTQMRADAARG